MQNPFTTTFSKMPDNTYIETEEINDILDNFSFDYPSESVYKITGVRGSGKTVILSKVIEKIKEDKDWKVYSLSTSRNLLTQLRSLLINDKYIKLKNKESNFGISASIRGSGGSLQIAKKKAEAYMDIGVEIDEGINNLKKDHKKLLIAIDEIYKCNDMIEFSSEFSKWLINSHPVYLICTGLFDNINQLSNVKNLTFFKRAVTIKTEPLNLIRMTEMYKEKLKIDHNTAIEMAKMTNGYAYAFQKLGTLFFRKKNYETLTDLLSPYKADLFSYSYEKIWEELSDDEKVIVKIIAKTSEREKIKKLMGKKANNYSVYRDRLIKKSIVKSEGNSLKFVLPYFENYIKEYC